MLIEDSLIPLIADVNFTSVPFGNYEIPFFAEAGCVPDTLLSDIAPIWWRHSSQGYYVVIKAHIEIAFNLRLEIHNPLNGDLWVLGKLTLVKQEGNYKIYARKIYLPSTLSQTLELRLYRSTMNPNNGTINNDKILTARSPIRVEDTKNRDQYLTFNYDNADGDRLGFPFTDMRSKFFEVSSSGLMYTVAGGVQTGATEFATDQTFFRDQRYRPNTLSANNTKTLTLTIGSPKGVPEYVGEIINNILSCDTVFLNGKRITRAEGSVPEVIPIAKSYPYVNFSVDVEIIPTQTNVFNVHSFKQNPE